MSSIINGELHFVINGKTVISINYPSFVSIENAIFSVSTHPVKPRLAYDFNSIIAGPVTFDPGYLYCGSAKSSLEGFNKLESSGINLDYLTQALVSSYAYLALLKSIFTRGGIVWELRHPLVSLFELSYLFNECDYIGVAALDKFILELKKKIGKKNEGTLKAYYSKLQRGELTPKELQGINVELNSKISELKVALRYSKCGYKVVYKGGMSDGGSDLIVIKGSRETDVEVRTRFTVIKNFSFNAGSPFPQPAIQVGKAIDISLPFNEEKNIEKKFGQGDIVVEDLTNDHEIGFRLSARNSFFPDMRRSVKEVLNEADSILLAGGRPLVMFNSASDCSEDWSCTDFARSRSFRV
jgi:hypothetical protein